MIEITGVCAIASEHEVHSLAMPTLPEGGVAGVGISRCARVWMTVTNKPPRPAARCRSAPRVVVLLCLTWGFNQVAVKLALPEIPPLTQARSARSAPPCWSRCGAGRAASRS